MTDLFAKTAMTAAGWQQDVLISIGEDGCVSHIESEASADRTTQSVDLLLPGIPNLHSHSFQRALAGRAEHRSQSAEDFWGWRERMYQFVNRLTLDRVQAVAQLTFVEMLEAGYTSVAEFHYLHDLPKTRDTSPVMVSNSLIDAAHATGIRMSLLPVLYEYSHFNRAPASGVQASFVLSLGDYETLIRALGASEDSLITIGAALHSLRAVHPESIQEVAGWADRPIHIHLAEQPQEIEDSISALGMRPVEWMLTNVPVSRKWCFVHATHTTTKEREGMAESGITVASCPSTEANLGDGVFDAVDFQNVNGCFGIGSDSQVCINPLEELRWLEYGQRLQREERHLLTGSEGHTGANLFKKATRAGRNALGQPVGEIAVGGCADFVVPDMNQASLLNLRGDELLDALVFAPARGAIKHVMVGGQWVVRDGEHALRKKALSDYREAFS